MAKAIRAPAPMTVEEFIDWAMAQPEGRYELVDGEVVAMAPERIAHARLKAEIWLALREAIAAKGLPCEALVDGAGVRIDDAHSTSLTCSSTAASSLPAIKASCRRR